MNVVRIAPLYNADDFPREKILDFLSTHPPRIADIFPSVSWLYKVRPDEMHKAGIARDVFVYVATNRAMKETRRVQARVGLDCYESYCAVKRIRGRRETDDLLRDDLDLLALRLAARVLERLKDCRDDDGKQERSAEAHDG